MITIIMILTQFICVLMAVKRSSSLLSERIIHNPSGHYPSNKAFKIISLKQLITSYRRAVFSIHPSIILTTFDFKIISLKQLITSYRRAVFSIHPSIILTFDLPNMSTRTE